MDTAHSGHAWLVTQWLTHSFESFHQQYWLVMILQIGQMNDLHPTQSCFPHWRNPLIQSCDLWLHASLVFIRLPTVPPFIYSLGSQHLTDVAVSRTPIPRRSPGRRVTLLLLLLHAVHCVSALQLDLHHAVQETQCWFFFFSNWIYNMKVQRF